MKIHWLRLESLYWRFVDNIMEPLDWLYQFALDLIFDYLDP